MNAIAHVPAALLVTISAAYCLVIFDNHRYDDGSAASHLKGYSGLPGQVLKERKDFVLKFIGGHQSAMVSNDFKPKDYIAPGDIVGIMPPDMFRKPGGKPSSARRTVKKPSEKSATPVADADSEPGESQIVGDFANLWSDSEFTPERIRNHKYLPTYKSYGLYEKPYGRVKVHTFRGPQKEYWFLPHHHHKPEQKTYAPWGYYVKQPVGSEDHKFHSPLDLSYHFD